MKAFFWSALTVLLLAVRPCSASELVAYYPFCGSTIDSSGHGNDAVGYDVEPTDDCSGDSVSAYDFNGVSSYILAPDSPTLRPAAFTVACWVHVRTLSDPSGADNFVRKNEGYSRDSFAIGIIAQPGYVHNQQVFLQLNGGWGVEDAVIYSPGVLPLGDWHHVAGTYDGSSMALYVDGYLASSTPYSQPLHYDEAEELMIGGILDRDLQRVDGMMDEVRVYNYALSPDAITELAADCGSPTAALSGSWGRLKSLYR